MVCRALQVKLETFWPQKVKENISNIGNMRIHTRLQQTFSEKKLKRWEIFWILYFPLSQSYLNCWSQSQWESVKGLILQMPYLQEPNSMLSKHRSWLRQQLKKDGLSLWLCLQAYTVYRYFIQTNKNIQFIVVLYKHIQFKVVS